MRGIAIATAAWCAYALVAAIPLAASRGTPFLTALTWQLGQHFVLAALSIPAWYITVCRLSGARWYWTGIAHAVLAPAYAYAGYLYLYHTVRLFAGEATAALIQNTAYWMVYQNLLLYLAQFAIYHGYEILRTLRAKERLTLELLALTKEAELATLRAQMNPHFLFNTLNSISAMASSDPEATRTMIAQLAGMLRYATESTTRTLVPLQEELTFTEDYLALEQRRMGDRLTATMRVDDTLASLPVPPIILQPLVENAVRHGIAPLEDGGSVSIEIGRHAAGVLFRITDTGVGFSAGDPRTTTGGGVGLKNTDARLRRIYGEPAGIQIRSLEPSGCEITFTLPAP
jgi:signal transduction histidine kinase